MSKKNDNAVTLNTPIVRDAEKITRVAITDEIKQAGSLRGLRLVNVLNMDTDSVTMLLTRVTSPRLRLAEINAMDTRDFVQLAAVVTSFLVPVEPGESNEAETETA